MCWQGEHLNVLGHFPQTFHILVGSSPCNVTAFQTNQILCVPPRQPLHLGEDRKAAVVVRRRDILFYALLLEWVINWLQEWVSERVSERASDMPYIQWVVGDALCYFIFWFTMSNLNVLIQHINILPFLYCKCNSSAVIHHTHTHTRTQAQTHTHTRTHARTHRHTHTHTCTDTHAHAHTHTHTHTHRHTHTHTHTSVTI